MMIKTLPGTGLPASILTIKYFALGGLYDLEHYMYIQLSHFKFACYNKDAYIVNIQCLVAPVIIRAKVKKVQTNITIYSHILLRIHVIGGQRSVRIAPPSLPSHHIQQPRTSSPPSWLKRSSEGVQGLLHQQLLSSAVVQHCGLLPVNRMVILPCMLHYS